MTQLSQYFTSEEFACKDKCGFDKVNPLLVDLLENVRNHFKAPVHIDSGCRCEVYNKKVGGVKHSQHVQGMAADIRVEGFTPDQVADWLEEQHPNAWGIGRYNTFTHLDCRETKARWDFRK